MWGDSVPNKWLGGLKSHDSSYKNKTSDLSLGNKIRMEVIKKLRSIGGREAWHRMFCSEFQRKGEANGRKHNDCVSQTEDKIRNF